MRAAVRSCIEPGSTGETHSGNPPGASTALMLPPWACAFPEYHRSMTSPFTLRVGSLHRSHAITVPSRITLRKALVPGPLQRLAQLGRLVGEHLDDLIQVPVGGGP